MLKKLVNDIRIIQSDVPTLSIQYRHFFFFFYKNKLKPKLHQFFGEKKKKRRPLYLKLDTAPGRVSKNKESFQLNSRRSTKKKKKQNRNRIHSKFPER